MVAGVRQTDLCSQTEAALAGAVQTGRFGIAVALDVTQPASVRAAVAAVQARAGRLDAAVANAGQFLDRTFGPLEVDPELVRQTFDINTLGTLNVAQACASMLQRSGGNFVAVSSGLGAVTDMGAGFTGYRLSKAAQNALVRVLHAELHPTGVRVNAVCPGWCRTDMGGPQADRSVDQGAASIVWAATLAADGPSGGFIRDGVAVAW